MEVQKSAAACLPAITASLKSDKPYIKDLIGRLIEQILKGKTLVDRNGAALGLAGVVKGLKIVAVNGYGILKTLKDGIQDKVNFIFSRKILHIAPMQNCTYPSAHKKGSEERRKCILL